MIALVCVALAAATPAQDAFSRLQKLAGAWEGTYQWSGVRTEGGSPRAIRSPAPAPPWSRT